MKLKTYAEMEQIHKEKFYTRWYGGLKDRVIDFIENNFIDIEGFNIYFTSEILDIEHFERIWAYKFLRSELWDMGFNLIKENGTDYRLFKRKKTDKYSKFLKFDDYKFLYGKEHEINCIQIITGKTYDEALEMLDKVIGIEVNKKLYGEPVNKTKNNTIVFNMNTPDVKKEEANIPTDVTEAIEQTLATDDSE